MPRHAQPCRDRLSVILLPTMLGHRGKAGEEERITVERPVADVLAAWPCPMVARQGSSRQFGVDGNDMWSGEGRYPVSAHCEAPK